MKLLAIAALISISAGIGWWAFRARRQPNRTPSPDTSLTPSASEVRSEQSRLEQSFHLMREEAHWRTDGPLLWGHFFLHASRPPLEPLAAELQRQGYRVVSLEQTDDEEDSVHPFMLHVERVEIHSARTLAERNLAFHALARAFRIDAYDGWDVGPAPQ
jgi:hypothetical protein